MHRFDNFKQGDFVVIEFKNFYSISIFNEVKNNCIFTYADYVQDRVYYGYDNILTTLDSKFKVQKATDPQIELLCNELFRHNIIWNKFNQTLIEPEIDVGDWFIIGDMEDIVFRFKPNQYGYDLKYNISTDNLSTIHDINKPKQTIDFCNIKVVEFNLDDYMKIEDMVIPEYDLKIEMDYAELRRMFEMDQNIVKNNIINQLKPRYVVGESILVRNSESDRWKIKFYACLINDEVQTTDGKIWKSFKKFKGNEKLLRSE